MNEVLSGFHVNPHPRPANKLMPQNTREGFKADCFSPGIKGVTLHKPLACYPKHLKAPLMLTL